MADNLTLNLGSGGKDLKTDELADLSHVPYSKLLDGTADSTTEIQSGAGTATNALRVTLASDTPFALKAGSASIGTVGLNTGTNAIGNVIVGGAVAHSAAGTAINPVLQGGISTAQDGTAPGTSVTENDLSYTKCDLEGIPYVNQTHPYYVNAHVAYGAAAQTNATIIAAVASTRLFITDIVITNGPSAVNYVKLLDGTS